MERQTAEAEQRQTEKDHPNERILCVKLTDTEMDRWSVCVYVWSFCIFNVIASRLKNPSVCLHVCTVYAAPEQQ